MLYFETLDQPHVHVVRIQTEVILVFELGMIELTALTIQLLQCIL